METIEQKGSTSHTPQSSQAGELATLIQPLVIPPVVLLSMDQHLGSPAEPVVRVDDKVLKGQLIAKAKGLVSANIHASTSGTVVAVAQRLVYYDVAKRGTCVVIEADGEDRWIERAPCRDFYQVSSRDLLSTIRASGIVDMEGEGLPAHIGLSPKKNVDTLIINACDWNNTLNADDVLLLNNARDVVLGVKIIRQILDQPERTVFAVEAGKETVAQALRTAIAQENLLNCSVELYRESVAGPDRQQLIETVTGQRLDDTGMAASVGCVCMNVATAYAIYRAICLGEPATSQIITVNGDGFQRRQALSVPLGTPLNFVLKQLGFTDFDQYKIRVNSLYSGSLLAREETPVNKRLSSLWSIKAARDVDAKHYQALEYLQGLEFFDAQAVEDDNSVNHTNALLATPAIDPADTGNKTQKRSVDAPMAAEASAAAKHAPAAQDQSAVSAAKAQANESTTNESASDDNPNLTLRSLNIQRLQEQLKQTEAKLDEIDPADNDSAEALLLSINIIIEKIQAAKALREEENTEAAANNYTLRSYISSLQERLSLAQNEFAKSDRAATDSQSAVKQALAQLEARLEDALSNLHNDPS